MAAKKLSKVRLAVALRISRTTLRTYLDREDAPKPDKKKLFDVEEVRAFVSAKGGAGVAGSEIGDLRARKLRLETEDLEMEMARRRGETVRKSEIAPTVAAYNAELTANLKQKFEVELPQKYKGKGMVECQLLNAAAIDWVLTQLKNGQWQLGLDSVRSPAVAGR